MIFAILGKVEGNRNQNTQVTEHNYRQTDWNHGKKKKATHKHTHL